MELMMELSWFWFAAIWVAVKVDVLPDEIAKLRASFKSELISPRALSAVLAKFIA